MENLKVSVIIAAKNEEYTIGDIVKEAKKYAFEILVIDGNSKDATMEIAKREGAEVFLDSGSGSKGEAIRKGIKMAKGDIIVLMDGDGSHDIRDIPKLIAPLTADGDVDMVVASRSKGGSDEFNRSIDERIRFLGSAIITQIINLRWKQNLTDVQNGFKAIKADKAKFLDLKEGVTVDQETVMKALRKGYRIIELPSHEYVRKHGVSKVVLNKVWLTFIFSLVKNIF